MKHYFQAQIEAVVNMSDEDFSYLFGRCQRHYDGTVKEAAEVGGFMYGWRNRRDWATEKPAPKELTFRQIDLLCKALEFALPEDRVQAYEIRTYLVKILQEINTISPYLNERLKIGKLG